MTAAGRWRSIACSSPWIGPRNWSRRCGSGCARTMRDNRWRLALGYLLAEQGTVAEAIQQFEAVEAADELSPSAYRASGRLVPGAESARQARAGGRRRLQDDAGISPQPDARGQAPALAAPGRAPADGARQGSAAHVRGAVREIGVAADLSPSASAILPGLATISACWPCLPDAVVGHTAAQVYPFVQGMQSVLGEVRDEATADEIVKRIGEVRPACQDRRRSAGARSARSAGGTPGRRGAEPARPAPATRPWPRWQRAFKRDWSPGEPRLMADFLAGLGTDLAAGARRGTTAAIESPARRGSAGLARSAAHRPPLCR